MFAALEDGINNGRVKGVWTLVCNIGCGAVAGAKDALLLTEMAGANEVCTKA